MTVLVTGAAGFIGCNLVRHLRRRWPERRLVSFDALTYAGSLLNLETVRDDPGHVFVRGDVADPDAVAAVFEEHAPTGVIHLAAESHVDRSIADPMAFVRTNVEGTAVLLRAASTAWEGRTDVRFHHVSTDEVFGALGPEGSFSEETPYDPRSPYSASKAAGDHLVRAWHHTFGLPVVITNCTNNYGPHQFPEKLIPLVVTKAMAGEPVPVYGRGSNVRDWLYVEDHCDALALVFEAGRPGETYCIGGECERSNLELIHDLLDEVDRQRGVEAGTSRRLVRFVTDRPGHDFRYAMDISRIRRELSWAPATTLREGLALTVRWYLDHADWCEAVRSGAHREFEALWYADRLRDADPSGGDR